jgi:hypothetical protein
VRPEQPQELGLEVELLVMICLIDDVALYSILLRLADGEGAVSLLPRELLKIRERLVIHFDERAFTVRIRSETDPSGRQRR